MPRFIAALIIGIGALANGWSRLGTPATAAKTFGPEGLAWGMMALGSLMLLEGISPMRRWMVAMKTARME